MKAGPRQMKVNDILNEVKRGKLINLNRWHDPYTGLHRMLDKCKETVRVAPGTFALVESRAGGGASASAAEVELEEKRRETMARNQSKLLALGIPQLANPIK